MKFHAVRPRTVIIPLLAIGALTVALAGCGGGSGNGSGSGVAHIGSTTAAATPAADTGGLFGGSLTSRYQQLVRYTECMHSHGEPNVNAQENGHGVGLTAQQRQAAGLLGQVIAAVRGQVQGPVDKFQRIAEAAYGGGDHAEQEMRIRVLAVLLQQAQAALLGGAQLVAIEQPLRFGVQRSGGVGC